MLFLKQPSAAPAASRFASVLPLPPPSPASSSSLSASDIQSERSSSSKSSLGPTDSNADSGSDESDLSRDSDSDDGDGDGDSGAEQVSDCSSSSISSALSFSSTTTTGGGSDDEDSDRWAINAAEGDYEDHADPEAPSLFLLQGRRRRSIHNRAFPLLHQRKLQHSRAISMQAIRNADTVGFVALLIPLTGIATMVATETLACTHHFDCTTNYPTLSYAATFAPEGLAFMVGMCLTALFILVSSCLFYWFLRLRLSLGDSSDAQAKATALVCLVAGVATAVTLAGLAIMDMRSFHDAHIAFTVLFFLSSWVLIVFCHLARRLVLLREARDRDVWPSPLPWAVREARGRSTTPGVWLALTHWRRLSVPMAYTLGRLFILAGITSTVVFGLLFLCVNGSWANPLGFTAVQEAFFEAFAIVCQLLFMGTLSCELALLSREVEARDYHELERRE
ncbi:hypothetical protein PybrP1_004232 [[Pythium] brassicae (nom. inval.)]|nr:hypothetical protein PybrP1_004232 [[Pythium] brassicae (nom. inval.)]